MSKRYIINEVPDQSLLAILRNGVATWNTFRSQDPYRIGFDLEGALLSGAQLAEVNLHEVLLRNADLRDAGLHEANLSRANLRNAKVCRADISEANLCRADLSGADLTGASLWGAYVSRASVKHTNFTGVTVSHTTFAALDFSEAEGLELMRHVGPSYVDLDSIGTLPQRTRSIFLRGCGFPDSYIEFIPSLLTEPVRFYSCFISYSTADQQFAERLRADLQDKGVRCWFSPHDIRGGRKLHEQIDEAIRRYDRLLLILSEESMNSEWVMTEIAHARQKELNERHQVLFPISLVPFSRICEWKCFDADRGRDSAREVREYFIPDFTNWKAHDAYRQALERLVRDLQTKEKLLALVDDRT
jgi:hypothetical protein